MIAQLNYGITGLTVNAIAWDAAGQRWNGTAFVAPAAIAAAAWATGGFSCAEQLTSENTATGNYAGTVPAGAVAGLDHVTFYLGALTAANPLVAAWQPTASSSGGGTASLSAGTVNVVTSTTKFTLTTASGIVPAAGQWLTITPVAGGKPIQVRVTGISAGVYTVGPPVAGVASGDPWILSATMTQAAGQSISGGTISVCNTAPIEPGTISIYQYGQWVFPGTGAAQTLTVTDKAGNPIDLTGKTLEMIVTAPDNNTLLWKWTTAAGEISAAGNVLTINAANGHNSTPGNFQAFLWDITAGITAAIPEAACEITVLPAPQPVAP